MEDNASTNNGTNGTNGGSIDTIGINEDVICRDYLRNVCTRGNRCKFKHPNTDESRQLANLQRSGLTFCHDFQNTSCSRTSCRFIHGTRQDEEHYRATGELPKTVLNGSVNRGIFQDGNTASNIAEGDIPLCKDFLKGDCHRGKKCKFRHIEPMKNEIRDQRQERNEEFEGPEAKRRHFMEENDFNSRSHVSLGRLQSFDFGPYFRERQQLSPPPSQRCFGTATLGNSTSSQTIHLQPTITMGSVCNHMELRLLQEENLLMRRKVEDLKKQVSDLMATNEFLLEQNAHLRIQSKIPTACSSVATVNLPAVTIANSMTVPATTSVQAIGLAPIPTVQSVQATATLPLVTHTAQSSSTLNPSIPYAGSVSLTQQTPMATVSIAPVTLNQTAAMAAPQTPSLSGAAATVTITPTLSATALQLGPNTALSLSGANGGSLVSYPIMTQSIIAPQTLQNSLTH